MARDPNARPERPNVVVFFTDQQRWDCSGLHGNPLDLMPNFDRVATEGTHVAHCFTPQPVCGPARACLQTGLYATRAGVWKNGLRLPAERRTLAHHFAGAGYRTGYVGKWHLADGVMRQAVPAEQRGGYEYWLGANAMEACSDAYDCVMFDNDNREVKWPGYRVDAQTDAMIRFIDAHRAEPFFLFGSFLEPHFQNHRDDYPAPAGYAGRYTGRWTPPDLAALPHHGMERGGDPNLHRIGGTAAQHLGGYWGMVKRLDEAFGRMLDALQSLGLAGRTIVLFTSDHACHFKTRNGEYKRSCHDSSLRVPTLLSGPGFVGGGRLPQLVSLVDLPPTLLDAAGLAVPAGMQGRSLLPLLRRDAAAVAAWPEEVFAQISEAETGRCVRTHRWKYSVTAPGLNGGEGPSSPVYREAFLYDLLADPYELRNLIGLASHRSVADRMRERLLRRMKEAGEDEPRIEPVPDRPSGQRRVAPAEVDE